MRAISLVEYSAEPNRWTSSPMPTIGQGVQELRIWDETGTYRVIYVARFPEAVYVLHAFPEEDSSHEQAGHRAGEEPVCRADASKTMKKPNNTYLSIWDAIADTPEQAANLRLRAELMQQITELVEAHGWTQIETAERCGVTQPRINDLLRGRVSRFSLDALVNIATALGKRVSLELNAA